MKPYLSEKIVFGRFYCKGKNNNIIINKGLYKIREKRSNCLWTETIYNYLYQPTSHYLTVNSRGVPQGTAIRPLLFHVPEQTQRRGRHFPTAWRILKLRKTTFPSILSRRSGRSQQCCSSNLQARPSFRCLKFAVPLSLSNLRRTLCRSIEAKRRFEKFYYQVRQPTD